MRKSLLLSMLVMVTIIIIAVVPVYAMSETETVQTLKNKGWQLEEDGILGAWSFNSEYDVKRMYDLAYSQELKDCSDLVLVYGNVGHYSVAIQFMSDEYREYFYTQGPDAMWNTLARWGNTAILSINGVPWQESRYREEYLAAFTRLYPACADPAWQEYLLDPAWNGRFHEKTGDPDRSEVYVGSDDLVVVRGDKKTTHKLPAKVYAENGVVMVPLRDVFASEGVGATVSFDTKLQKTIVKSKGHTVVIQIGSKVAKVDGKNEVMPVAPTVINGATFVPARFVAEKLGHAAWLYEDVVKGRTEVTIPRPAIEFRYAGP